MTIIEQLKQAMEEKGITQRKLAFLSGTHFNTVWSVLNGKRKVTTDILEKWLCVLGMKLKIENSNNNETEQGK